MDRLSRCKRDFCPRMSQLTASTCHGPFVTDLPARISSPTLEFSLLKENLAGSQSIFKDILHASQGQLSDVPGPMNHFGSSATFTKNCLHFPTGRSSDPPWEASGELIYLPWKSPPSSEAGSRHHLSTSNY